MFFVACDFFFFFVIVITTFVTGFVVVAVFIARTNHQHPLVICKQILNAKTTKTKKEQTR